jgi:glycosyltransferase involved in cell wall biosynthesis
VNRKAASKYVLNVVRYLRSQYLAHREPLIVDKMIREPESHILAICYKPREHSFMGVKIATVRNFNNVWQISEIYNATQTRELAMLIIHSGFRRIIFNVFTSRIASLIDHLQRIADVDIDLVYHGSLAQLLEFPWVAAEFDLLLQFVREGKIRKIGFAKQGMAGVMQRLGYQAEFVMNRGPGQQEDSYPLKPKSGIDIGVFGTKRFRKNYYTQLMAALMISDARVHVIHYPDTTELVRPYRNRIVDHGYLNTDEFLSLSAQMDLNLYVSLSECWPEAVIESLALGVPCITSHTSEIFQYDEYLFNKLVETALDNPNRIAERIRGVLEQRGEVSRRCREYARKLNTIAESSIKSFLDS